MAGTLHATVYTKDFAGELKKALMDYLDRPEPRTFKREAELRKIALDKALEASQLLEKAVILGDSIIYWINEYEKRRTDLLKIHELMKSSHSEALAREEQEAIKALAQATSSLAAQVAVLARL